MDLPAKASEFPEIAPGLLPDFTIFFTHWNTSLGEVLAIATHNGLFSLQFLDNPEQREFQISQLTTAWSGPIGGKDLPLLAETQLQLDQYFSRQRQTFDLPLMQLGTPFQQSVWKALLEIPYGHTRSYMEQAHLLGNRGAIRAVAAANGANPLAVIVPCHRVLGAGGKLTGYRGGLWRKQALLDLEQPGLFG